MTIDSLFTNEHILAALYFTDMGHYIFKRKTPQGGVTSKFLQEPAVAAAFSHKQMDSGWLPDGIVRVGTGKKGPWYVYAVGPRNVSITIKEPRARKKGSSPKQGTVTIPIPTTVLVQMGKESFLFALKTPAFDPKAQVYEAPFPNVHSNGVICWGTNAKPKADPWKAKETWERFFQSPFNSDLANHKSKKHPDSVIPLLRSLDGKRKYPLSDLVEAHSSIGNLINRMLEVRDGE